jgi:Protein-L-isoaspartate(D-aspartate) O-methyltransferase (PCMT)
VLDVGTGHGFLTALMAPLAREVWSVERWPDLAAAARGNLARCRVGNAHLVVADGTGGLRRGLSEPPNTARAAVGRPRSTRLLKKPLAGDQHLVDDMDDAVGGEDVGRDDSGFTRLPKLGPCAQLASDVRRAA